MSRRCVMMAVCLFLVGCGLRGTHTNLMSYRSEDDLFEFVHLWSDISCENSQHQDQLRFLWNERESVLVFPYWSFWGAPAIQKVGNYGYRWTDLTQKEIGPLRKTPDFDFDSIQLMPVKFYTNSYGHLCSIHQMSVTGEVMDRLLVVLSDDVAELIAKSMVDDLEQQKKWNWRPASWDDLRRLLLGDLATFYGEPTDEQQPDKATFFTVMELASKKSLYRAAKQKTLKIVRMKDRFRITLPISEGDIREVIATFELVRNTSHDYAKQQKEPPTFPLSNFLDAISLNSLPTTELEISLDFSQMANAIAISGLLRVNQQSEATDKEKERQHMETIKVAKESGIAIDGSFDVKPVLLKFAPDESP